MWHLNMAWWSGAVPDADRAIDEPAPWTPGGLMSLQAHIWEQVLVANRNWWQLVMSASLPAVPPPAGVVVPPRGEEEAPKDDLDAEPVPHESVTHQAARRLRPAASGPARARIKHQRKQWMKE